MRAGKKNNFKDSSDHSSAKSFRLLLGGNHRINRHQPPPFFRTGADVHFNLRRLRPSAAASPYRKPHPRALQCRRSETVNVQRLSSASIKIIPLTKATVARGADVVLFEVGAVDLPTRGRSLQSLII